MSRAIILGSGAAPGVTSVSGGWGACNPNNPKNKRQRAGVYLTDGTTQILMIRNGSIQSFAVLPAENLSLFAARR